MNLYPVPNKSTNVKTRVFIDLSEQLVGKGVGLNANRVTLGKYPYKSLRNLKVKVVKAIKTFKDK